MVACVLAANMSTCSNFMVNTGRPVHPQPLQRLPPPATPATGNCSCVGRFSGLALTLLGVLFALSVDQVLDAFLFTETIAALMGIMFMGGILWKRANRHGALAAACALVRRRTMRSTGTETGSLQLVYKWLAAPFGWATLAGVAALIVVSLLTPPEKPERVEQFFDNMQRSTDREGLPGGTPQAARRRSGAGLDPAGRAGLVYSPSAGAASSAAIARTWWDLRSPGRPWACWCSLPGD